ncbi:haloacid dehalogenase [Oscillospiraceae bacterium]|nr:haloacid dehalogenase [Oscillospiraceae bacterium]BDF76574.1 haloacid dehalogenase [Oscillospiraceae bacterium]
MVKLIACDVDGTLLPPGETGLPERIFALIEALHAGNVRFCAASGRQYASLRRLFAPVSDKILYLCENGAIVYRQNAVLAKTPLARPDWEQLCAQICAQPGCEVLLSGADTSYVIPKTEAYYRHIRYDLGNNTVRVGDVADIEEDVIKVSAFTDRPADSYAALFAPVWGRRLNVAVAGKYWLDFTLSDKGTGLAQIAAALRISAGDILAFGDNFNDIPMFRFAGASCAMEHAVPEVRAAASGTCASVECFLESLVRQLLVGERNA